MGKLVVAPSAKAESEVPFVSARVAGMQQWWDVCAMILLMRLQELAMSDVAHERRMRKVARDESMACT